VGNNTLKSQVWLGMSLGYSDFWHSISRQIESLNAFFVRSRHLMHLTFITASIVLFVCGIYLVFDVANDWVYWKYDDAEHLSIAFNLYNGKGFVRDFIDLGADRVDTNIAHLSDYDQISNHLRNKFPLYFVLLGGWLTIFQANFESWYFLGSLFNSLISILCIIVFYFFIQKYFEARIALISSIILAATPAFIWFAVRIRPDVLAFLFIIMTLYLGLRRITWTNSVLIGILAGLSHFSHTIGLLPGIAIIIYFLIKRKFKHVLIIIGVWLVLLIPWLARNFLVFGDALQGTGIPVPRDILIKIGLVAKDAPNLNVNEIGSLAGISLTQTIDGMIQQFSSVYGMQYFMLFVSFSFFAFVCYHNLKKGISSKRKKILFLMSLLVYGLLIGYIFQIKNNDNDIDIQLAVLFITPFFIFIYLRVFSNSKRYFTTDGRSAYTLIAIFVILSFIPYFMYAQVTGRVVPEPRIIIHSLYFLIPLAVIGIYKLVSQLYEFSNWKYSNGYAIVSTIVIITIMTTVTFTIGISTITGYYEEFKEMPFQTAMHEWINQNIPKDAKIASELPHIVLLETGRQVVNFAHPFKDSISYEKWIIKKFDIDYLVFYYYNDLERGKGLEYLNLGGLQLEKVYEGKDGGLVYKVIQI
jgi:hypothetical protein